MIGDISSKSEMVIDLNRIRNRMDTLYTDMIRAVEISKNSTEEKLKNEVLLVLRDFFVENGIDFSNYIDYERSDIGGLKLKGRTDAVCGTLIMEFKAYNLLKTNKELRSAIQQVEEKYLKMLSKELQNVFYAVIFDGVTLIFVKFDGNEWSHNAEEFNVYSFQNWLFLLASIMKKTVSPESLEFDFSINSPLAKEFISIMYSQLNTNFHDQRIQMLFNEWDKTFRYIYGGVLEEKQIISDFNDIGRQVLENNEEVYLDRFLFIIYTYYSFIIKLIASEISSVTLKLPFDSPSKYLMSSNSLKEGLTLIENGGFFKSILRIDNYIEGGFFSWYLDCFDANVENIMRKVLYKINEYNPDTFFNHDGYSKDILRNLYQNIIPQRIRHDLGEYYTPDWLVQFTVEETGYNGDISKKVLDPGCGSGPFLIEFIDKIKRSNPRIDNKELLDKIIKNVIGFDVNPVAVLTARTNYLLSISDLLESYPENITIPVFLADSVLTPTTEGRGKTKNNSYIISTVEGIFEIPKDIVDTGRLQEFLSIVEICIENDVQEDEFKVIFNKNFNDVSTISYNYCIKFYSKMYILNKQNKNKIWTKIIQNSFAPLLYTNFDFVIGNPPWIKWEFLSQEYKQKLSNLYLKIYKLYSYRGMKAGMGFAHDDISIVFTYVCIDKYLKEGGFLGFVLKQTLYKSIAGKEFRKFKIETKDREVPVKVIKVHDLLKLKPFKTSSSETSVAIIQKGNATNYPVPYFVWDTKKKRIAIGEEFPLIDVRPNLCYIEKEAYPDPKTNDKTDVWVLFDKGQFSQQKTKMLKSGQNSYAENVWHGVVNDLNNVFIIKILGILQSDLVMIENAQKGRKKLKNVKTSIEKDLIYPLLKPRHVKKWAIKGHDYMIVPHKIYGQNNEAELQINTPYTYKYLLSFKEDLLGRKSRWFKGGDKPFYSLFGIGNYTFKPYKVVWSSIGYLPYFAVIGEINDKFVGKKIAIPDNTIGYISFDDYDEALYVCGILNSNEVNKIFARRSSKSKWGVSIRMVKDVPIPKFDKTNSIHVRISEIAKMGHNLTENGKDTYEIETELDNLVKQIL